MLAQHPLGDDRSPTATLRDARADLREIDDGLAECDRRLADPSVYNDGARMEAVLAEQALLLDRYERPVARRSRAGSDRCWPRRAG